MIVQNLLYREQRPSSGSVLTILEDGPALFCTKQNRCGLAYDRAYTVYRKKWEICTFECESVRMTCKVQATLMPDRVSSSFCPRGQNEIVWVVEGGKYVSVCKACGKLRRSGA